MSATAQLYDFVEQRICARLEKTLRVANLEVRLARASHELGRITDAQLAKAEDDWRTSLAFVGLEIKQFEAERSKHA